MRLLNVHTFEFKDFSTHPPAYVIASHRWTQDEATYKDILEGRKGKAGYNKVVQFARYVKEHVTGVDWLWIDTCCIDKTDKVELETAINSMFHWYRDAVICLAYLPDVDEGFTSSVWFKRGWTLQELLAPKTVVLLNRDWQLIGHKGADSDLTHTGQSWNSTISIITSIPAAVLADYNNCQSSADEKLEWLNGRETTRAEDMAYCMLGLLNVSMRISYGTTEGKKAMIRLRAKLVKMDVPTQHSTALVPYGMYHSTASVSHSMHHNHHLPCNHCPTAVATTSLNIQSELAILAIVNQLSEVAALIRFTYIPSSNIRKTLQPLIAASHTLSELLSRLVQVMRIRPDDVPLLVDSIRAWEDSAVRARIDSLQKVVRSLLVSTYPIKNAMSAIQGHMEYLERARSLLLLELSVYSDKRPGLPLTQLTMQTGSLQELPSASLCQYLETLREDEHTSECTDSMRRLDTDSCPALRSSKPATPYLRVRLAFWALSTRLISITVTRAHSGWDVSLRFPNLVSRDAEIFMLCWQGNIKGLQHLISTGKASVLDVAREPYGDTSPLYYADFTSAAMLEGHLDMCKFLLSEMPKDEREERMLVAIAHASSFLAATPAMSAILQLFVEQYGMDVEFDADVDRRIRPFHWWQLLDKHGIEVLLRNMTIPWSQRTTAERFHLITRMYMRSVDQFLSLLQVNSASHEWITLRDQDGRDALHLVARQLCYLLSENTRSCEQSARIASWSQLGSAILRAGLDPHRYQKRAETALSMTIKRLGDYNEHFDSVQQILHVWQIMIVDAALDPNIYIRRENAVLMESPALYLAEQDDREKWYGYKRRVRLAELRQPCHTTQWEAILSKSVILRVHSLTDVPGSFQSHTSAVTTICWEPDLRETAEGHWSMVKECGLQPSLISTLECREEAADPFESLIDEATQDDAREVIRLLDRCRSPLFARVRSHSQSFPVGPRSRAVFTSLGSRTHRWLPRYHLCPRSMRYSICPESETRGTRDRVRLDYCLRTGPGIGCSLHEHKYWKWRSFLAGVDDCRRDRSWGEHTGKPDCPHKCFDLSMKVIERIRAGLHYYA